MAAARVDLLFELNAALDRAFVLRQTLVDPDTQVKTRVPVDLTGYTARLQVRTAAGATGPPLLDLTTENGGITLGGAAGTIALYASAGVVTAALGGYAGAGEDRPNLAHDLLLISGAGRVRRLFRGAGSVSQGVTVSP